MNKLVDTKELATELAELINLKEGNATVSMLGFKDNTLKDMRHVLSVTIQFLSDEERMEILNKLEIRKRFRGMELRFKKFFDKDFGWTSLDLIETEQGFKVNYTLGINYIINSIQADMGDWFTNTIEMIKDEIGGLEYTNGDLKANGENYGGVEESKEYIKTNNMLIHFFKLELLRATLDELNFEYEEDETAICFVVSNYDVMVHKTTMIVANTIFKEKLYKDIDDLIKSLEER